MYAAKRRRLRAEGKLPPTATHEAPTRGKKRLKQSRQRARARNFLVGQQAAVREVATGRGRA